jgi:hypothetical protein
VTVRCVSTADVNHDVAFTTSSAPPSPAAGETTTRTETLGGAVVQPPRLMTATQPTPDEDDGASLEDSRSTTLDPFATRTKSSVDGDIEVMYTSSTSTGEKHRR